MNRLQRWLEEKAFWFKTGGTATMQIANDGKPVDEVVIRYKDFYFGIMIDVESGEPTGDFAWSRNRMMFHTPIREDYVATRDEHTSQEEVI